MENTCQNHGIIWPSTPYQFQKQDSFGNYFAADLLDLKSTSIQDIGIITTIVNGNLYTSLLNFQKQHFGSEIDSNNVPTSLEFRLGTITTNGKILSIVYYLFTYFSGAAHGLHAIISYNFVLHPFLMEIDSIEELFNPKLQGLKIIIDYCQSELVKIDEHLLNGIFKDSLKNWDDFESFTFMSDGIHFYFQDYQIGPYSSGNPEINIPYDVLSPFLNTKFLDLLRSKDF
jgi:hypothetical protein